MRIMYDRVARFFSLLFAVMLKSGLLEGRAGCFPLQSLSLLCPFSLKKPCLWSSLCDT